MSKDSFGLRISVTLDDDMAKQKLEELKKGFEVPLGFDTKEIANSIAQMKQIKELEITSIVQDEALKSLEKMNAQLILQTELLTKISALNKTEPKQKEENHLKEAMDIQKKIFSLRQKQIGLTKSEQQVIDKRIGKLYDELDTKKSLITDTKQLNKLEEERKKLQDDFIMSLSLYETKQKNIASTEEARKAAKVKKGEEVDAYREMEKNIRKIAQLEIELLTCGEQEKKVIKEQIADLRLKNKELDRQLQLTNNINDRKENKIANVVDDSDFKIEQQKAKLSDEIAQKNEKILQQQEEEKAKAKELAEYEKQRLELRLKNIEAGRNGDFIDTVKANTIHQAIMNLDGATTEEVRKQVRQLNLDIRELSSDANVKRLKNTGTLIGSLKTSFANLTKYVSGAMIIRQFWTSLREGIQTVKELDEAVTTLRITMEKFSDQEINTLIKKSQELSKTLKANVNDVLTAVKTVANENESMETILAKTTPSVILSNLTGLGTDQTVEMIQGATQQFEALGDGSAESAMKVADSMVAISKSLSMDFSKGVVGMSEGVEILGSLADQVEMDLDTVLSVMSATAEKTRLSYSEIANALKTTISRTMRVADPSGEVSEEDMLKTEKALNSVGIAIRNLQTGEMRPFMDVITDLSDKWDDMTEAQQGYVADAMGGARQLSTVLAVVKSQERAQELLTIAQNGSGTAMKAQEEYAESLAGKMAGLSSSIAVFWQTFINSDAVEFVIDSFTSIIDGATFLVETFGTAGATVGAFGIGMTALSSNFREFASLITGSVVPALGNQLSLLKDERSELEHNIKTFKQIIDTKKTELILVEEKIEAQKKEGEVDETLIKKKDKLNNSIELQNGFLKDSQKQLLLTKIKIVALQTAMSMGLSLAITAVTSALSSMITKMTQASKIAAELAAETQEAYKELRSGLESNADGRALINQYEELSKVIEAQGLPVEELKEAKNKLAEIEERLIELYPEASKQIDEQGKLVFGQIQDYKDLTEAEREYYEQKLQYLAMEASVNRSSVEAQIKENEEKLEKLQWKFNEHRKSQSQYEYGSSWHKEFGEMASEVAKEMATLSEETFELKQQLNTYDSVIKQANSSQNELIASTNKLNNAEDELADTTNKLNDAQETAEERVSRLSKENRDVAKTYLDLTEDLEQVGEWLDKIGKNEFDLSDAQAMLNMFEEFEGDITNVADIQDFLNNKIKEMAQAQGEAYAEMRSQDEAFWSQKYKDSEDWINYVNSAEKDIINIVTNSLGTQSKGFIDYFNDLGGFRDVDLSNVKNLADAKGKVESHLVEELKRMWSEYYKAQSAIIHEAVRQDVITNNPNASMYKVAAMVEEAMKDLNAQNDVVTNLLNNINTTVKPSYSGIGSGQSYLGNKGSSSSSSSSSSTKKEVADLDLVIDRYYELESAMKRVENALSLNKIKQENATATEKVKLMKEEVELLKEKQGLTEKYRKELTKEANELKKSLSKNGVLFDSQGNITNYAKLLTQLEKSANKLSGEAKENKINAIEKLVDDIERYTELINSSIPSMTEDWADLTNQIKEAQRAQLEYVTDIQEKITDALKDELQKRTDAVKAELEKQKNLYNEQFEEEDWKDSLTKEQRKLDELKQQISSLSRDTSLAGQLKLEDLMSQYEEQLEVINQMIRDREKEKGNEAFDSAIEDLDQKLENALDPKNLAQMVNQALTQGFIDLGGEVISTENLLTQMLETSGEAFTVLGQTLRKELIDGLQVAKGLASDLGSTINGIGFSNNARHAISVASANNQLTTRMVGGLDAVKTVGRQVEQAINLTFKNLLNVEGNLDSTILADVELMLDNAKNEITYSVAKALQTI